MALRTLYSYQREVLQWALPRRHIALFLEMRLGKTIIALRWSKRFSGNILIVCPLSVVDTWINEMEKEDICPINLAEHPKLISSVSRYHIINYEKLITRGSTLPSLNMITCPKIPWEVVMLDESTRIKNPKAKITKACCRYFANVKHKAILSGLPNPESEMDYVEQLRFLYGRFLGCKTYWQFRHTYYNAPSWGWKWTPRMGTIKRIKRYLKVNTCVLTREEVGMANKKINQLRTVILSRVSRKVYDEMEKNLEYGELSTKIIPVAMNYLSQIAGGRPKDRKLANGIHNRKITEVLQIVLNELPHERIVIWFRFNKELKAMQQYLKMYKVRCRRITGDTPLDVREKRRRMFHKNRIRVLLLQIKCAKFGTDLSCADSQIYFSNSWSYEDRAQSIERLEHPERTKSIGIIDIVAKDTVDEDVLEVLNHKKARSSTFNRLVIESFKKRMIRLDKWKRKKYAKTIDKHTRSIARRRERDRKILSSS